MRHDSTNRYRGLPLAALAALAALALPATAARADTAASLAVDEIVVTATRRPTTTDDISSAISLIDSEDIARHGLVTDALAGQPGVFLQQTTPGQGAAIVRGLKGSAVLHLVDGMRLNNAIFRSAPTQYLSLVPAAAVERIELLRGTPASLYGSDAIAGVVNVITRTPRFDGEHWQTRGENVAQFDSADLTRRVYSTVDAGNARHAVSLTAEWQRVGNRRTGAGSRLPAGGYDARGMRALWVASPTPTRRWRFDLHTVEQPMTPRIDELLAGFGETEPAAAEFFFAPNRRQFAHAGFSDTDGMLGLDWQADLAWQRIDDDRISRDLGADERQRERNRSDLTGITVSAGRDSGVYNWVGGIEASHDVVNSSRERESLSSGAVTTAASRFPDGASVSQAALFANLGFAAGERHTLHAGARLSRVGIDLPDAADGNFSVSDLSGDIGWLWHVDDRWSVTANLGAGFRAPNIFDLGTLGNRPGNRFNVPNTRLAAEQVLHADTGLRYRDDRFAVSLSVFRLRYDDRIVSVLTGDVTDGGRDIVQSVNAAAATVSGAEFALAADLSADLSASAFVNVTRGDQRIDGLATEPADRVPPLNGQLRLSYLLAQARVSAHVDFAGRQDRLSASDRDDNRIDPDGTAGWVIVGLSWERDLTDRWLLAVRADNLLDQRYRPHGSGIDGRGRGIALRVAHRWE